MDLRNRPITTMQTPESPLTEMTSQTHTRARSNSLPPITARDMANPFIDREDLPGHAVPSTPVAADAAGTNASTDIHHNPIHHLPTDPLPHVSTPPEPARETARQGLESLVELTDRIRELETNLLNMQRYRDRVEDNPRPFNAESHRSRGFREGTFASNSTYTNEHPRSKIKPSDLPKFYGKDNEDIDE
jgi:hypothetical protein